MNLKNMVRTESLIGFAAGYIFLAFFLWVIDRNLQTSFFAVALKIPAGIILNGLLTGFGFFAATLLWAVVSPRESDGFGGAGLVMSIFGFFGSIIGGCSGMIIGLFGLSSLFAASVGAMTYLICFFKFNGLEGRIIPAQTPFRLIMLILIPGIINAFSGAVTARLIDHPFFR